MALFIFAVVGTAISIAGAVITFVFLADKGYVVFVAPLVFILLFSVVFLIAMNAF